MASFNEMLHSLEIKDYITIIGIVITAIVSLITLYITSKTNKKNLYMNSVTKERVTSLNELKEQVARYISSVSSYTSILETSKEEVDKMIKENEYRTLRIMLQLNPNSNKEEEIYREMIRINSLIKFKESLLNIESSSNKNKRLHEFLEVQDIQISSFFENYEIENPNRETNENILIKFNQNYKSLIENYVSIFVMNVRNHLKEEWEKVKNDSK